MSVSAFDRKGCDGDLESDEQSRPAGGFWRRLARTLDRLGAYPTANALSDPELRRVSADIERCHGLICGTVLRRDAILGHARRALYAGAA